MMRRWGALCAGLALLLVLALWTGIQHTAWAGSSAEAKWPEHPGSVRLASGKLVVDASHAEDGYFMACVSSSGKRRLKLQVSKGDSKLTYDLKNDGSYEVFPLQFGSGKYEVALYENISGKKYSAEGKVSVSASLTTENAAFLVPSQYVWYTALSEAVGKSDELCGNASDAEKYEIICKFMKNEFMYDFIRAATISSGMLPEVDACYEKKMGICQDLAAVMVCMLRVQGIPAKLVIGYADKNYHAWTSVILNGEERYYDPTAAVNAIKAKKYSIERVY